MRFNFTSEELHWLRTGTTRMLMYLDSKAERPLVKQAARLHYKFTPNAHTVFMNQSERLLMFKVAEARLASLTQTGSLESERDIIQAVMKKLAGRNDDDANQADARE